MNILPKKRWHVRTKANIDRVRKDEAKAAAEEKELERRIQLAEQESRTELLRKRARREFVKADDDAPLGSVQVQEKAVEHVNFFKQLEDGNKTFGTNPEYEKEKKEEQEKLEKSIGLLTYLTKPEDEGETPWYLAKRRRDESEKDGLKDESVEETAPRSKDFYDPMKTMEAYLSIKAPKKDKKHHKDDTRKDKKKKTKNESRDHRRLSSSSLTSSSSGNRKTLEQLRCERLQREKAERARAERLLARMKDGGDAASTSTVPSEMDGEQRYNSQFNPHLARKPTARRN